MKELFPQDEVFDLTVDDGALRYLPNFLDDKKANALFERLLTSIPWQEEKVTVYGKTYDQPRLTSLHSIHNTPYRYSNLTLHPHPFTSELTQLLSEIKEVENAEFNAVLLNLYRHGKDSNGWHADDEKELGNNPVIASISLGEERYFHLKHKTKKEQRLKLKLSHGSLLIMGGAMQHHWLHQIPKTTRPLKPRINLTFRKIILPTQK